MKDKNFQTCEQNIRKKYGNKLEIRFKYNKDEGKVYLIYFSESIDFLDDDLLYDLYTQIDEILIPNGLKNVSLFFDSEKKYIKLI